MLISKESKASSYSVSSNSPLPVSYCPLQGQELSRLVTVNMSETYHNVNIIIISIIILFTCNRGVSVRGDISEYDHMTGGGILTTK